MRHVITDMLCAAFILGVFALFAGAFILAIP